MVSRLYRDEEPLPTFVLLIAGATQLELARHVRYLKIENEILRSKLPKRVPVTPKEQNRLVKFGAKLGKALSELVTIVHPDTLRRWIRDSQQKAKKKPAKKGRPRTQEQIRELILKLACENDWGYTPPCARQIPELFGQSADRGAARAEGNSHV